MAGSVTHYFFAKDLLKKLNNKTKNNIKPYQETLFMFSQGPDTLLFTLNAIKGKSNSISSYIHKNNTRNLFLNIINYIINNHLENNYEIMAFLYGFLTHYILDTNLHPYVNYKAGRFDKKNRTTYKNNCKHNVIEQYIDAYFINKDEHVKPSKYKVHKYLFTNATSKSLNKFIDDIFYQTYSIKHASLRFKNGKRNMKFLYHLMRYDPFKIKYYLYRFIDKITPKTLLRFTSISYYCNLDNDNYYLNLDHKKWCHPLNNKMISNKSVIEIYNDSLNLALQYIKEINDCIYNHKDIKKIDYLFTNLSMSSGYDEKVTSQYLYFEENNK